jgi:hypothetical protein
VLTGDDGVAGVVGVLHINKPDDDDTSSADDQAKFLQAKIST